MKGKKDVSIMKIKKKIIFSAWDLSSLYSKATANEQRDEALAQEINEQHQERLAPFTFSACGIAIGETIEFCCNGNDNNGTLCEVVDDKHVSYNGETWSLTALAKHLTGVKSAIAGPKYFKYKGEWLNSIRQRLGV